MANELKDRVQQWWRKLPPLVVGASAASGIVAGIAFGAVVGPVGVAVGVGLGTLIGFVAGTIMMWEDGRATRRTRELDAIIGITEGSMGKGGAKTVPSEEVESERWVAEWLTPPPPPVA